MRTVMLCAFPGAVLGWFRASYISQEVVSPFSPPAVALVACSCEFLLPAAFLVLRAAHSVFVPLRL